MVEGNGDLHVFVCHYLNSMTTWDAGHSTLPNMNIP